MLDSVYKSTFAVPTLTTGAAYAAGQLLGGKLQFPMDFFRDSRACALLEQAIVRDKDKQSVNSDLILFDADPTGTTFTDKAAFDVAAADLDKVIAAINLTTQVVFNAGNVTRAGSLSIPVRLADPKAASLIVYGALICRSTPTFSHADALSAQLALHLPGMDPRPA